MRISLFRGASATGPFRIAKTSHNSITFESVARETFTEHRYLPTTLGSLPSYRITNVTKHTGARTYPPPAAVAFLARGISHL